MKSPTFFAQVNNDIRARAMGLGFSFVLVFTFSLVFLNILGLTPEPIESASERSVASTRTASAYDAGQPKAADAQEIIPTRVVVESVGIDARVIAPMSKDIKDLDAALLKGAVHYPGSGTLLETANMFIFGHSSHLPVVNNKNFKAFNNLEKVKAGDLVRVEAGDLINIYQVRSVELVSADEALIQLGGSQKMLTLSTCNSFGDPSDRYVVKADFVKSYELTRPVSVGSYIDKS